MRDKVSRLGRPVSSTHHSWRAKADGRLDAILVVAMEMVINLFCDSLADAGDALEFAEPGARDRPRRAEMMQQCPLAPGADPGDLVERRMSERLCPFGAMGADGKAVRFVAQA